MIRFTKAKYEFEDLFEFEEFLNELYAGLKRFQKENQDFTFTIKRDNNNIEVKTVKMNESIN